MDEETQWQSACEELIAALQGCARRDCGIGPDAAAMVTRITEDPSLGAASVRHAARVIRRDTPAMVLRAREVEGARRAFWRARGVDPDALPFGGGQ